ncbi:MAG TPA: sigma factor-like helix-turn-helix DNA-binding protein [Propionibacteriaceae bacterium]|nr:sigma factor-like helix-turn-helix DNA-binding protein [Propionibacteriaceae bacterium]
MSDEVDPDDLEGLAALAAALTGDRADAARVVGETLAAAGSRRRAPDRSALRGLLVESYLRRRESSVVPPGEDLPDELRQVAERLSGLSPIERAAVVLARLTELPLAEVAATLDTSATTVRRRLAGAEERLAASPLTIRATLETLSWRTPDAAAVASARFRGQRTAQRRRGRIRILALALGVVLLVALVVPTVRMLQPLPVRRAGSWVLALELEPPPGWTTELHAVTPNQELLQLTGRSESCRAVASLPSTPEEERVDQPARAERAWVRGRPVRYFDGGVRWPYGEGGDVTLTCTNQDRAGMLAMAEQIDFSAGRPFTLPFALSRLPTGLRLVGAGYQDQRPVIALARRRMDTFVLVTVTKPEPAGQPVILDGVNYRLTTDAFSRRLCRTVQSVWICVEARDNDVTVPRQVARSLRFAPDLRDRSTWFDAREALPA